MRENFQNNMDNTMSNMFNANRKYIEQEISRKGSFEARDTDYKRNGMLNFGARQMTNFVASGFFVVGSSTGSPIVGP